MRMLYPGRFILIESVDIFLKLNNTLKNLVACKHIRAGSILDICYIWREKLCGIFFSTILLSIFWDTTEHEISSLYRSPDTKNTRTWALGYRKIHRNKALLESRYYTLTDVLWTHVTAKGRDFILDYSESLKFWYYKVPIWNPILMLIFHKFYKISIHSFGILNYFTPQWIQ